jgi:predicted porin
MMKKSLIALAVLASTAAFAQTTPSVTVYGNADIGVNVDNKTDTTGKKTETSNLITNGISTSRIGFKGERDIVSGLKANFAMEFELDQSTETITLKTRTGTIGLAGAFGSVSAGRRTTLMKDIEGVLDANDGPSAAGYLGDNARESRRDDMITWNSPVFNGFSVDLQLALGATQKTAAASGAIATSSAGIIANGKSGDSTSIGFNYANGPLVLKIGTETVKNFYKDIKVADTALVVPQGSATFSAADRKNTVFGASYNFGVASLYYVGTGTEQGTVAIKSKFNTNTYGIRVPVGQWTFNAGIGQGKADVGTTTALIATQGAMKAAQASAWYALNKETTLYAVYGNEKITHSSFTKDQKESTMLVGMRYKF